MTMEEEIPLDDIPEEEVPTLVKGKPKKAPVFYEEKETYSPFESSSFSVETQS